MQDESQQQTHYLLQVQKLMSSDIQSTFWSHNMDLLVIVTVDNILQLYRINFKAQKVFQIQQDKQITAVAFSPDSQYISYGMGDGAIKVLKTENGEILLTVSDHLAEQINLPRIMYQRYFHSSQLHYNRSYYYKYPHIRIATSNIFVYISFHRQAIIKLNYFNHMYNTQQFTMLLSSSQKHTSLHLNGFVTVAQIDYDMIVVKQLAKGMNNNNNNQHLSMTSDTPYTIHYSHYNPHQHKLQTILIQSTSHSHIIYHVSLNCTILKQLQPNIIKLNCLLSYVNEIIDFVQLSYPAAQIILRDILRQYNQKMVLIDDPQRSDVNPCQELFKYLNYGITSTPIVNFLTKQVYDTKVLQKLDEVINAGFNSLHQLLLESVQNSLQRAYMIVYQLKSICQLQKYKVFNVSQQDLLTIQKQVQKLYTMGEILLVQSTQAKFDIRNLLVWLNKATIKTSSDPNAEIQNTKSHLSRYTVDFGRLHSFIQTQERFKLQNLIGFFAKGQEQFQMRVPQCEFRLLGKTLIKRSQQYVRNTRQIQLLLQLDNITLPNPNPQSHPQLTYKSFRLQLKHLKQTFKGLKSKPIIQLSKIIQAQYSIQRIAQIQASQLHMFQVKHLLKKNQQHINGTQQLLLYYIQHNPKTLINKLFQYNTITKHYRNIIIPSQYHPLSIGVGVDVILLLQNTMAMNEEKMIVGVGNQEWEGESLIVGRRIQGLSGEVHLDAGLRGLNLMVVNKNKLVVFD